MLLDAETLAKSAELRPELVQWMKDNPIPSYDWDDLKGTRANLDAIRQMGNQMFGAPDPAIAEEFRKIPMRDGFQSEIRIFRPATPPAAGSPLIVNFFAGGFIGGHRDFVTPYARAFVRLFGAVVVAPTYRLAPEHKFPTAQNDGWDTVKWVDEHASEIGADLSLGFIVGGTSAGGGIGSAIATHAIEDNLKHPITGQQLICPTLLDSRSVPEKYKPYYLSVEHARDAPLLPSSALESIAKFTEHDPNSPWRYPVLSKNPRSRQPPAFFQVCGLDPIRDDALIWDEILKENGVKTKVDFYPGLPHVGWGFMPGPDICTKAVGDHVVGMGWLLGKEVSWEQGIGSLAPAAAQ